MTSLHACAEQKDVQAHSYLAPVVCLSSDDPDVERRKYFSMLSCLGGGGRLGGAPGGDVTPRCDVTGWLKCAVLL